MGYRDAAVHHGRLAVARAQSVSELVISRRPPRFDQLRSQFPSALQGDDARYVGWMGELGYEDVPRLRHNRKIWEWCFILEALNSAGLMAPGRRALGFGVGRERIPALLASRGVAVVATDQPSATAGDWATKDQHSAALDELRCDEVVPTERFERLVSFRALDMNDVPADLVDFDMMWSSCAFEHLGSPEAGTTFALESLKCLKPGGIAVHTTEVRVDGGPDLDLGGTVLYSVDSMRDLVRDVRMSGHRVTANFHIPQEHPADRHVDTSPYTFDPAHLKLRIGDATTSSFGLIIRTS